MIMNERFGDYSEISLDVELIHLKGHHTKLNYLEMIKF